jgi:hypothetical protein
MAKVMPRLAWMLTNSVWPVWLNVAPANSSLNRLAPVLEIRRCSAMSPRLAFGRQAPELKT